MVLRYAGFKQPLFAMLTLFALVVMLASPAFATSTKVAVVDVQKLMSVSKAAVSIQKQIEDKRQSYQKEFAKHEDELRKTEKSLAEARNVMSADEFNKKREGFENSLLETRKLVQKRRRSLETAAADSLGQLRNKIVAIVANIADSGEYDLVINRQNIILVDKSMDITEQVLAELDKTVAKIDVKVEKD